MNKDSQNPNLDENAADKPDCDPRTGSAPGVWRICKDRYPNAPEKTDETHNDWQAASDRCKELNQRDGKTHHWVRIWEPNADLRQAVQSKMPPDNPKEQGELCSKELLAALKEKVRREHWNTLGRIVIWETGSTELWHGENGIVEKWQSPEAAIEGMKAANAELRHGGENQ